MKSVPVAPFAVEVLPPPLGLHPDDFPLPTALLLTYKQSLRLLSTQQYPSALKSRLTRYLRAPYPHQDSSYYTRSHPLHIPFGSPDVRNRDFYGGIGREDC